MKRWKKGLALLLALVMAMGLSVTTMASETDTVTVTVQIQKDNGYLYNDSVTLDKDKSLYTLTDASSIENYGTATAMDAILATGLGVNYYKVQYLDTETWEAIDRYGLAFDKVGNCEGTSVKNADGTTTYYYWELKIDGSSASEYATSYKLTDGMLIQVDWSSFTY